MFHARFGRQRRDGFDRRSIKLLSAGWIPHVPVFDGAVLTLMIGRRIYPAHSQVPGVPLVAATAAAHSNGRPMTHAPDFETLVAKPEVQSYLGRLMDKVA